MGMGQEYCPKCKRSIMVMSMAAVNWLSAPLAKSLVIPPSSAEKERLDLLVRAPLQECLFRVVLGRV